MTVKQRLTEFAKTQEKSVRAFEIKAGLTIGYINSIRVSIQPDKLQCIASHYPNLNTGWLLTGEGEMLKKTEPPTEDPAQSVSDTVSMPREAWEVIRDQAASLRAKDDQMNEMIAGYREKDRQINDVIALLKKIDKKGEDVGDQRHAVPGAALG